MDGWMINNHIIRKVNVTEWEVKTTDSMYMAEGRDENNKTEWVYLILFVVLCVWVKNLLENLLKVEISAEKQLKFLLKLVLWPNYVSTSPCTRVVSNEVSLSRRCRYSFAYEGDRNVFSNFLERCLSDWSDKLHNSHHTEVVIGNDPWREFQRFPSFCLSRLFQPFIPAIPLSTICDNIISQASRPKGVIAVKHRIQLIPPSCHIWQAWSCLVYTASFWSHQTYREVLDYNESFPTSLHVSSQPLHLLPSPPGYFHSVEIIIKWLHLLRLFPLIDKTYPGGSFVH